MYKIKCPVCKGTNTAKNGKRNGVQLYICRDCPYQFRNRIEVYGDKLWSDYQDRKQTISELADAHGISQSTVKRRLREVEREWVQPALSGSGFVHLDTTYWGHNWGVLLAIDEVAGSPLYVAFWKKRSKTSQKTGEKGECRTLQKSFEMLKNGARPAKTDVIRAETGGKTEQTRPVADPSQKATGIRDGKRSKPGHAGNAKC